MNDLAMAAGLATLAAMRQERILAHTREVGDLLMSQLRSEIGSMEMVKEIRGLGLMIGVEFQRPRGMKLRMGWDLLHKLDNSLFCQAILMPLMAEHRILAQVAGHAMDIIKLIPPLVLSKDDACEIAGAFKATVGACHTFPGPAWEVGKRLTASAAKRLIPVSSS
jgi:ornithine--oxo-acid transaminase